MDITKSIIGLTKYNNGFFKSEKQARFLISKIESYQGCIGHSDSGYNTCPIFAEYDNKGIVRLEKHTKKGIVTIFVRDVAGILNELQIKEIKSLERKAKRLQKEVSDRKKSFEDGSYNSTGDTSTYTSEMIERYNYFQNQKIEQVQKIQNRIKLIKNEN